MKNLEMLFNVIYNKNIQVNYILLPSYELSQYFNLTEEFIIWKLYFIKLNQSSYTYCMNNLGGSFYDSCNL
ncbi:hypothetical protein GCM10008909_00080 [Hathewaya limosa]|nr:hypothetical protein C3495_05445 [Clostridiaceae bacterium 14S0207]